MIQRTTLDNGVRIVTERMATVRSVSLGIWVGTGSRFEEAHENGVSHFLEHMLFKGTEKRTAQEIAESFDRIGGQVNAFTSKEYTCYYAKVLDEHAAHAVDVLSDMFFHSTFEKKELEKEQKVVLEEIKMVEDTPDDIIHDLLSEATYGSHALGYPILGTETTLKSFDEQALRSYMDRYYTGDYVVVSIAGNVSDELVELVKETFKNVKPTTYRTSGEAPSFLSNQMARKKETEQAHLCLGYPGLAIGDEETYSLILLNNTLGGSMSSRLFQEIRENRGLCYSVFSYHSSYHDSGMLTVYAGTAQEQLDDLADAIEQTTRELAERGMSEKELVNGKEQLKGSLMLSLESTNSRMSRNGKNEMLLNRHRGLDDILDEINQVTLDRVNDLAAKLLKEKPSVSLISSTGQLPKRFM